MSLLRKLVKNYWTVTESFSNVSEPKRITTLRRHGKDQALRLATVWACVKARAEDLGALPVHVVERRGKQRIEKPPPTWLQQPNPETTVFELIEHTSASIDVDGNAFWWLMRDRLGRVGEVWVLPPSEVHVHRDRPPRDDPKRYMPKEYRVGNEDVPADEILHIRGFSLPGRLRGLNPIQEHMVSLGLAMAAEEYGEAFFRNGATMSGVIEAEADPGEDNVRRMQASFELDHSGVRNAHRPGFLFGGAKWRQLTIPNDAAQFLETRQYQRQEICAIFRVPPHKAQILDRATWGNIEHQAIEWVTDGLVPTISRIEKAVLAAGLLDRGDVLRIDPRGRLRGDMAARYAAYAIGRQWGWLSADDIRELEDEDPLPDGQGSTYLVPLNMLPAGGPGETAATPKELAEIVQKIYLGVGKVLTEDEARDILNRAGAGLAVPGPDFAAAVSNAQALARAGVDAEIAVRAAGLDPATHPELIATLRGNE